MTYVKSSSIDCVSFGSSSNGVDTGGASAYRMFENSTDVASAALSSELVFTRESDGRRYGCQLYFLSYRNKVEKVVRSAFGITVSRSYDIASIPFHGDVLLGVRVAQSQTKAAKAPIYIKR
ncbi:hypothetical protein EVAR_16301_1 [Eumeta japonica]|uniref:Uncharacterized protein n=1 Tax=Eumeta variegata TaxID=151549 RepID=A0A4C1VEY5_EUMVA|nr:hypothetical protein EVAR_16301_1 [Eumeta japonica]